MEHIVDKEKMDSLKALAETNMKVSETKNILIKLEETETEYLVGREKKAMERIQKVHDDSADLLKETHSNYELTSSLLTSVSASADFLGTAYEQFKGLLTDFEERNEVWEKNCEKWEANAAEVRQKIKVDQVKLENAKKSQEIREKAIENSLIKLADDEGTLKRAIGRLKEGRI